MDWAPAILNNREKSSENLKVAEDGPSLSFHCDKPEGV